jgi:hypothetical protein
MTASTMLEERDVGFGTGSAAMEMEQGYQGIKALFEVVGGRTKKNV